MESGGRKRSTDLITSRDLISEILLRLPTKSLMRLKATCKFWNSIISDDPNFAELHCRTWVDKTRLLFESTGPEWEYWIHEVRENGTKLDISQRLPFKYWDGYRDTLLKHSLGGLFLFTTRVHPRRPTLFVYDSISGNQILLPGLPTCVHGPLKPFLMYDASINMHKVLIYTCGKSSELSNSCYITSFCKKTMAMENVWRMTPTPFEGRFNLSCNTSINGTMYLLGSQGTSSHIPQPLDIAREKFIMPFDIPEDRFLKSIDLPDELFELYFRYNTYNLLEMRGVLGFMLITNVEFRLWVLTDRNTSSWNLLHKFSIENLVGPSKALSRPLFVLDNIRSSPSILLMHKNKYYWIYMNGEKVKKMNGESFPKGTHCVSVWVP